MHTRETKPTAVLLAPGHETSMIRPGNGSGFDMTELAAAIGSQDLEAVVMDGGAHVLLFSAVAATDRLFNETASELVRLCGLFNDRPVFGTAVICSL